MGQRSRRGAQRVGLAALAVGLALPAAAQAVAPAPGVASGLFDSRTVSATTTPPASGGAPARRARDARAALRRRFGSGVALDVDPITGATRSVQRLDGALTGPASGPRAAVARAWLRSERDLVGLDAAAVDGLMVAEDGTQGPSGVARVRFVQRYRGLDVYDGGVQVTLDRGGRVLAAAGTPLPDAAVASVVPRLDAPAAEQALAGVTGPGDDVPGSPPRLVIFGAADGPRLAWHLISRRSSTETDDAVVDAGTGRVLLHQNLTKFDAASRIYPSFPGAQDAQDPELAAANAPQDVDLEAAGYLPAGANRLSGPYAHAFSDFNDNDSVDPGEEVVPQAGGFVFDLTPFSCGGAPIAGPRCTWDPFDGETALRNRRQGTVQAFALVNRYHDHLLRPAIGFDAQTGFSGTDPVDVQTLDGASTAPDGGGGPDRFHVNNANMTVLPGDQSPKMQMYLFKAPYRAIDGGQDAATVWHEYTHGLSGRLITRADGTSALSSVHAGALGEGWSDFYALDELDREGLQPDDPSVAGDVDIGRYSDLVAHQSRTQGADCPVAPTTSADPPACPPGAARGTAGVGGYTFGDLGRIDPGGAEVHADGEIWLETLWDMRRALIDQSGSTEAGSDAAERLITDGMRLSPPEPSFLDERNAILAADTAAGGTAHELLWKVFARRGVGWFAGVQDAADVRPVEDFHEPPLPGGPTGTVAGRVTDSESGLPLAGVRVGPAVPGSTTPSATTDADGRYVLTLPTGSYARLQFTGAAGFDLATAAAVTVGAGTTTTLDRGLHRDWAAQAGGAALEADPHGTCGPSGLIDEAGGSDWSAVAPPPPRPPAPSPPPPSATVILPAAIDITAVGIDPAAGCGDPPAAALRSYQLTAVKADGSAAPLSGTVTLAPGAAGRLNFAPSLSNTRGVVKLKLTLIAPQQATSPYIDVAALTVYGYPANQLPTGALRATPATVLPGQDVRFDASFTDPDSLITGYSWDFDGDGTTDRTTTEPTTVASYPAPGAPQPRVLAQDFRGGAGQASVALRVTDPTPPTGPATTPAPPPTIDPTPTVAPTTPILPPPAPKPAPKVQIPTTGRRGAGSTTVTCASRCSVRATASVSTSVARRLKLSRRTVLSLQRTIPVAATRKLGLTLSAAIRAAAKRARLRTVAVAVTVHVTDAAGRSVVRRASVSISI